MTTSTKPNFLVTLIASVWLLSSSALLAQSPSPTEVLATVNGKTITKSLLDQVVAANQGPGKPDTPEVRRFFLEELINRELVSQDAVKNKLDKTATAQMQLEQVRQTVLVDLAMNAHVAKTPITEAELRAEYKRQIDELMVIGAMQQYQLRLLLLPTEAQARQAIRDINQGKSMEDMVRQTSADPSRETGGLMDWALPNQMQPAIGNVVVNLSKGKVTAAPIQAQNGWAVLRVEDIRPFVPPKFEDATNQLRASVVQQRRLAYVNQLRKAAKIVLP